MRDSLGYLNWFWQFLCEGLSSFNLKEFCYSYAWSCSLCEGRTSFCTGLIFRKLWRFLHMCSTGFTSLSVLLLIPLLVTFFVFMQGLFCLTWMMFSQSTHLLMCLSLETLRFIIGTGKPILVEMIDLVNSVKFFKLKWLCSDG